MTIESTKAELSFEELRTARQALKERAEAVRAEAANMDHKGFQSIAQQMLTYARGLDDIAGRLA